MLWASFWRNNGNSQLSKLPVYLHFMLLQRAVLGTVMWKLSRWPYQKTVAVLLDGAMCRMAARILPCERKPTEDIDQYCRRRKRQARDFCGKAGFWSTVWAGRVIGWFDHVHRSEARNHMCAKLLRHHDAAWLRSRRAAFSNVRNTLFAGQTGTRAVGGKPQPRWEEGVLLAKSFCAERSLDVHGKHSLSVGARIRNALLSLRHGSLLDLSSGSS